MKKYLVLFGVILMCISCGSTSKTTTTQRASNGKTLFTHDLRRQIEEFGDIKKVQFYTTRRVKMRRLTSTDGVEIAKDGTVVVKEGDYEESITLERDLPGVCVSALEDRLEISFNDGSYLIFRKDFMGTYSLQVERDMRGVARVQYGTESYQLQPGSDEAKLAIAKQFKKEDEGDERVESGRKIGGSDY